MARDRTPSPDPTPLEQAVRRVLADLPVGGLATYGEVAEEAGYPGRARAVGRILAASDSDLPWWRVVSASGRLVPGLEVEQARLLALEGIEVDLDRGRVRRSSR